MGKKGSWFSAIKRVFTHSSKEKPITGSEKKKNRGILKHGEAKSLIPLFREPSSIEKILGEADQLLIRPPTSSEHLITPPDLPEIPSSSRVKSPNVLSRNHYSPGGVSSPQAVSPRAAASPQDIHSLNIISPKPVVPKVTPSHSEVTYVHRPEPTLRNQHLSATRIQAAYRGYLARRSFRALRGLVRLQGVVRSQNAKRQTMNAMKQMQLLVRVQTQIQSRRIQMLENQVLNRQAYEHDKEVESTLSKWTNQLSEAGNDDWDDSLLTKEEVEARLRRKVEAVIKRERAMAYSYSNQLWKGNPKSAQTPQDIRFNGFPWWWNWLDRQLPPPSTSKPQAAAKSFTLTPPRPISEYKPSPRIIPSSYKQGNMTFDNSEAHTPRSSRSTIPVRGKRLHTPSRTPPPASSLSLMKYSRSRAYEIPLKDDDSLTSCPPFNVPNYMAPTASAKAKVRASSTPKDRSVPGTPGNDSKRRFSFPLTPNIGSFKWNKASNKDSASPKVLGKHQPMRSTGDVSVDSAISMPVTVGRKPFNRFV